MVEIIVTGAFKVWYEGLAQSVQESAYSAVTQLEEKGVSLGFPRCSDILGSRYPLRELRIPLSCCSARTRRAGRGSTRK